MTNSHAHVIFFYLSTYIQYKNIIDYVIWAWIDETTCYAKNAEIPEFRKKLLKFAKVKAENADY